MCMVFLFDLSVLSVLTVYHEVQRAARTPLNAV